MKDAPTSSNSPELAEAKRTAKKNILIGISTLPAVVNGVII